MWIFKIKRIQSKIPTSGIACSNVIVMNYICFSLLVFRLTRCFAYNAKEIRIGRIPSGVVGKPVEFESKY